MAPTLIDQLDAALPQTQCTRCGYPACKPYAQAMAQGLAPLNRCPPGGQAGIEKLAAILGQPAVSLDPAFGVEGPRLLASIETEHCIGCTKCIIACPVDAIIGGPKWMHTVLPELCTGCELCVPPCPVDCIRIEPADRHAWSDADANAARKRFELRTARRQRNDEQDTMRHIVQGSEKLDAINNQVDETINQTESVSRDRKKAIIEAAITRARKRQAGRQ